MTGEWVCSVGCAGAAFIADIGGGTGGTVGLCAGGGAGCAHGCCPGATWSTVLADACGSCFD